MKVSSVQLTLEENKFLVDFPDTRYQGSKSKIADWIWGKISDIEFDTVLDAFAGTGVIAHKLKREGKEVTYNDLLEANYQIGVALIENSETKLSEKDIRNIVDERNIGYDNIIQSNFEEIYFTPEENKWLDIVIQNIETIENRYKRAIAYFALFQSCIIKRPFNLFHRKNLYIRFADVNRNFGNKTTWDKPFEHYFRKFIEEANKAIFSNNRDNKAMNMDALNIKNGYELVYIDTPYVSPSGVGVDYYQFYHFLEGILHYHDWEKLIDSRSKHHRLKPKKNIWCDPREIYQGFERVFKNFEDSILVISYRTPGIPSKDDLIDILGSYKKDVKYFETNYKYVLTKKGSENGEILLIGK
jgi:Adenine-specific DNA methylase